MSYAKHLRMFRPGSIHYYSKFWYKIISVLSFEWFYIISNDVDIWFTFRVSDMLEAKTCQQYFGQIIVMFPRLQTSEKQTLPKRSRSHFYDNQLSTLWV